MREHLERLSEAAGIDLIHYGTEAEEETIKDTAIAQPLIVAAGIVTGRLALKDLEGEELVFAGHSVGEITAAALAGVLSEEDAMRFVRVRANGMAEAAAASPTGMAAVLGGVEDTVREAIVAAGLVAANSNGGGQIVAAGPIPAIEEFCRQPAGPHPSNSSEGCRCIPHRSYGPAVPALKEFADSLKVSDPSSLLLTNRDGSVVTSGEEFVQTLVSQVTSPVRWDLCMATLLEREVSGIIEVAPAGTLVGLAKRAMRGVPGTAINTPRTSTPSKPKYGHRPSFTPIDSSPQPASRNSIKD